MNNPTTNSFRDAFPVIRFDYRQRLLSSDVTALPMLNEWQCRKGTKIPHSILRSCPELEAAFDSPEAGTCVLSFGDLRIWFDLVPYPEAGYVGMYGYHIESMVPENKNTPVSQNLRMAG